MGSQETNEPAITNGSISFVWFKKYSLYFEALVSIPTVRGVFFSNNGASGISVINIYDGVQL